LSTSESVSEKDPDVWVIVSSPCCGIQIREEARLSRERRAACMRTLRWDGQHPWLPEGPPAWTTTAPRWGQAPTAVHYDTLSSFTIRTPFLFSVVSIPGHVVKSCLMHTKTSSHLGPQTYWIYSIHSKLLIYQNLSLRHNRCIPKSFSSLCDLVSHLLDSVCILVCHAALSFHSLVLQALPMFSDLSAFHHEQVLPTKLGMFHSAFLTDDDHGCTRYY
jgi:hypothetical protein